MNDGSHGRYIKTHIHNYNFLGDRQNANQFNTVVTTADDHRGYFSLKHEYPSNNSDKRFSMEPFPYSDARDKDGAYYAYGSKVVG